MKADLRDGIRYIFEDHGLVGLILMSFFLNFLFGMIRVLIIPWFHNTGGFGEIRYGFLNGACSVGMICGMLILSVFEVKNTVKYRVYCCAVFLFIALIDIGAFINNFWAVLFCFAAAFAFQVIFNTLMCTTILINTDETMRGKVTAARITLCMAASPIGNFAGGVSGDLLAPRMVIIGCSTIALTVAVIFLNRRSIRQYFKK